MRKEREMTEFSKNELFRLVDKIPETDPTSTAYHVLMQSIECFNSLAPTVDEIIALRDEEAHDDLVEQQEAVTAQAKFISDNVVELKAAVDPEKVPVHPIPEVPDDPTATNEVKPIGVVGKFKEMSPTVPAEPAVEDKTVEEKTYAASDVRKALVEVKAKGVDVKEVLSEFGVADFRALPASKYGALMKRLEAM